MLHARVEVVKTIRNADLVGKSNATTQDEPADVEHSHIL